MNLSTTKSSPRPRVKPGKLISIGFAAFFGVIEPVTFSGSCEGRPCQNGPKCGKMMDSNVETLGLPSRGGQKNTNFPMSNERPLHSSFRHSSSKYLLVCRSARGDYLE